VIQKFSRKARTAARQRALQALYQWHLTAQPIQLIEHQFLAEQNMQKVDMSYFQRLLRGIPKHVDQFDRILSPLLDRQLSQLDPIEHVILHIGCYELFYCADIPFRVAINEAVELAKTFGAEASHKYVNGILDKVSQKIQQSNVPLLPH
jgi:N utilization substance protein B